MIVVALTGERIGTVERIEIDKTGRLKALIVQIASAIGTRKRINAEQIHAINGAVVEVTMNPGDIDHLADERQTPVNDPWDDEAFLSATG